jgi:hypothetical protein
MGRIVTIVYGFDKEFKSFKRIQESEALFKKDLDIYSTLQTEHGSRNLTVNPVLLLTE